jgi:hypothetical protein
VKIALATALRKVSKADTAWPYVLPRKQKKRQELSVLETVRGLLRKQYDDIEFVQRTYEQTGNCFVVEGDARDLKDHEDGTFDFAFASCPYLNNFDYSDRTRLEMFFFGEASSWKDITEKVRRKLIMSATTQISRRDWNLNDILDPRIPPEVQKEVQSRINDLSRIRLKKGGRKSYDILVGGYFTDMCANLSEMSRVLRAGSTYVLVLGDSAPYGVHIPTEEYLGRIGVGVGFRRFKIVELRRRGDKWKSAPKHHVSLRESILILEN